MTGAESSAAGRVAAIVGREAELTAVRGFVEGVRSATCLVLSGEPGIGKTTLWEAGLDLAREHGYRVLSASTSEGEATLSFAALADLIETIGDAELASIPPPQLRALDVALLRVDSDGTPADPFGVAAGFLNLIRSLQERSPVLIAIDDVQWLDPASSDPILFAARRLSDGNTRFLLSRRSAQKSGLERVLLPSGVERLEVTALSLGAIGRMLSDRIGMTLPRPTLRRLHEGSHGNPLFALELGRLHREGTTLDIGRELPVPDLADVIFGARLRDASPTARRVLLVASLSPDISQSELSTLVDPVSIDEAVATDLVVVDRLRLRASHPMLAAAARKNAAATERQALHLALSSVVADPIAKARHLALSAAPPDARLASAAAAGADLATSLGRVWEAVELGEHALRLTLPDDLERADRVLALARLMNTAGRLHQAGELLTTEMANLPPGRPRAMAHMLLAEARYGESRDGYVDAALAEAGDDPEVQALAFSRRATQLALNRVERLDEAEMWAHRALAAAESAHSRPQEPVVAAVAWVRVLRGAPISDLGAARQTSSSSVKVFESIDRLAGVRFAFRGQVAEAREIFGGLLSIAEERGELVSVAAIQLQLCELELRAGHLREVATLIDAFEEVYVWEILQGRRLSWYVPRLRALRAATAGDSSEARRWAAQVLDPVDGERSDLTWDRLDTTRALGLAALFERDTDQAIGHLRGIWDHTRREHVDDPGAFPVAGDLVEEYVRAGRVADAIDVTAELRRLSLAQDHPWGLATSKRCEALVRLAQADRYLDDAAQEFLDAADSYGDLGLEFDRARTLLEVGVVQRRYKKRALARATLEEAAELFDRGESSGWASRARHELDRVSGRRSSADDQLTPTENRVASLASQGMSNKEIATNLFVTINTVEGHLSRAYAKLGVSSRGQLAQRLAESVNNQG